MINSQSHSSGRRQSRRLSWSKEYTMNTRGSHGDDDSDDDDNEFALNSPPQSPAAGPPKKYQLAPPITPRTPRRGSNGNGSGLNTSSAHASRNNVPKTPNKATKTNNSSGSSNKTPTSSPIKKRHSITSGSSSSNNHHHSHRSSTTEKPASGKDVQVLTEMVQTLAQKLKKRDVQVQELSATSVKYAEVCLQLEHAEERLVTLSAEKSSLQRQVHSLQTQNQKQTFQDAVVGDTNKEGMSLTTSPITTPVPPATVDMEEFRSIRSQRDTAMFKAGELSIALAESRAEQDELRDHLTAVTDSLSQQQKLQKLSSTRSILSMSSLHKSPGPGSSNLQKQGSSRSMLSLSSLHQSPRSSSNNHSNTVQPSPMSTPLKSLQQNFTMLWSKDSNDASPPLGTP